MNRVGRAAAAGLSAVAAVAARDLLQREHTLLRNFPVIGHARYLLEEIGPELRQYLVAGNNEERPFTRDQRRWVYASAKKANNYFGFGTDNDLEYTAGYPVINHRTFGRAVPAAHVRAGEDVALPGAKVLGSARGRAAAFRPGSVVNISAMSFGSLSGAAVDALNRGAALAGCLQNTGEAASRSITATAVSWCSRSVRRTSAVETSTGGSTWTGSRTWLPARPCGPWRSSSARAPNPAWAACSPARRCPARSRRPAGCLRASTA